MKNAMKAKGWPPPAVVRELQQNEFRAYFDAAPFAMVLADANGRFIEVNNAGCQMLGYERDALLGDNFLSTLYPENFDAELAAFEKMRRGEISSYQTERRCFHRSGETKWIRASVGAIRGPDQQIHQYIAHAEDVTAQRQAAEERRRLQEAVRRSEQLSAMGGLVGGVAHEVRNPLFAITATIDAMESRLGERTEYQKYVKALRNEAARMTELMQRLLAYGKPVIGEHRRGDLIDVLRAAEAIEQLSAGKKAIRFRVDVPQQPVSVSMDFDRLVAAFQNLLDNALQFSPENSNVEISVVVEDGNAK